MLKTLGLFGPRVATVTSRLCCGSHLVHFPPQDVEQCSVLGVLHQMKIRALGAHHLLAVPSMPWGLGGLKPHEMMRARRCGMLCGHFLFLLVHVAGGRDGRGREAPVNRR